MKVSLSRQELLLIVGCLFDSAERCRRRSAEREERLELSNRLFGIVGDMVINGDPEANDQPKGVIESPARKKLKRGNRK